MHTYCHGLRGQEVEGKQEQRTDLREAARSAPLSTVAHSAGAAILPPFPPPAPPAPAPPATTTPLLATPFPAMAPATPATTAATAATASAASSPTPTHHLPIYHVNPDTLYTDTCTDTDTDTDKETQLPPTTEIAQARAHNLNSPCPRPLTQDSPAAATSLHTNTPSPTIVPTLASHPPPFTQTPIPTAHPATSVNTPQSANTPPAHTPTPASNSEKSSLWRFYIEFSWALTFENECLLSVECA